MNEAKRGDDERSGARKLLASIGSGIIPTTTSEFIRGSSRRIYSLEDKEGIQGEDDGVRMREV